MKFNILAVFSSPKSYKIVRWAMGLVFFVAGMSKLVNFDIFIMILEIYVADSPYSLSITTLQITALILAFLEIITGVGIFFDKRGFLTLMAVQLFSFVVILIYGIATGLDAPCGCFVLDDPDKPFHSGMLPAIKRDIIFVGATIYLYWHRWHSAKN